MTDVLHIYTSRDAYSASDCIDKTMTVGELIDFLQDFDEETPIVLNFDGGYTYGYINSNRFDIEYAEEDE